MSQAIFYEQKKSVPTKFRSFIKVYNLLAFKDYKVWIGYNNGQWILYDVRYDKLVQAGQIDGNRADLVNLFVKPRIFDPETVVYVNVQKLKLHLLNVNSGNIDQSWDVDVPTLQTLGANDRTNIEKAQDVLDDFDMVVLEKSKVVVVMERRDQVNNNSEYALTAFTREKKEAYATISISSQMKKMYLTKVNEEDTIILFSDYQTPKMKFHLWNLRKTDQGWKNFEFEPAISATIVYAAGWDDQAIAFFGNPDQGNPEMYYCNYEKNQLTTTKIENLVNKEVAIKDAVWSDPVRSRILFEETGSEINNLVTLYNLKSNKTEFYKTVPKGNEVHALSQDGKYFVGYEAQMVGEEDPNLPFKTNLNVNTFVNKKLFVVFMMKRAKINVQGKSENLLGFYGSPYIARDVAEMLTK